MAGLELLAQYWVTHVDEASAICEAERVLDALGPRA